MAYNLHTKLGLAECNLLLVQSIIIDLFLHAFALEHVSQLQHDDLSIKKRTLFGVPVRIWDGGN